MQISLQYLSSYQFLFWLIFSSNIIHLIVKIEACSSKHMVVYTFFFAHAQSFLIILNNYHMTWSSDPVDKVDTLMSVFPHLSQLMVVEA